MIGLYCVLVKKNLVKIVIGMAVMEYAVNLFFIMLGYRTGGMAPIVGPGRFGLSCRQGNGTFHCKIG